MSVPRGPGKRCWPPVSPTSPPRCTLFALLPKALLASNLSGRCLQLCPGPPAPWEPQDWGDALSPPTGSSLPTTYKPIIMASLPASPDPP